MHVRDLSTRIRPVAKVKYQARSKVEQFSNYFILKAPFSKSDLSFATGIMLEAQGHIIIDTTIMGSFFAASQNSSLLASAKGWSQLSCARS